MSNLIHLPEELKKEFKLYPDGKTSCSIRGLGRMFMVNHSRLVRHFLVTPEPSALAKTLMEQGFDSGDLESWGETGVPDVVIKKLGLKPCPLGWLAALCCKC